MYRNIILITNHTIEKYISLSTSRRESRRYWYDHIYIYRIIKVAVVAVVIIVIIVIVGFLFVELNASECVRGGGRSVVAAEAAEAVAVVEEEVLGVFS